MQKTKTKQNKTKRNKTPQTKSHIKQKVILTFNLQISLITGSSLEVNVTGTDMHIAMTIQEDDFGPPGGVCGNTTWFQIPVVGHTSAPAHDPHQVEIWK